MASNQNKYSFPPMQLIKNVENAEELAVLYMLHEGISIEEISKKLNKPIEEINNIIEKLYNKKIILDKKPIYMINPIAVWNNLYFVFIKIEWRPPIYPPLDEYPSQWPDVVNQITEMINTNNFLKRRIFAVFNLQGIEWDILLIVGANDKTELRRVIESIVSTGLVSKVWSFAADSEGWYMNTFSLPPMESLKPCIKITELYNRLSSMLKSG